MKTEKQILKKLQQWAEENDQIRGMILFSSQVDPNAEKDVLSDFDIELYVKGLEPILKSDKWLEAFGSLLICWPFKPELQDNWVTRLAVFEDGLKIDFMISLPESLKRLNDNPLLPHYANGYKVLIDKDNFVTHATPPTYRGFWIQKPTQEEYESYVHRFWWNTTYIAKCLWRDQLYFAKYELDSNMRFRKLQKMIEWYLGTQYNWTINPGIFGRKFKKYLDQTTWDELEATFVGGDIEENWEALFRTIELFRRLALIVGDYLGYNYPHDLDTRMMKYLTKIRTLEANAKVFPS